MDCLLTHSWPWLSCAQTQLGMDPATSANKLYDYYRNIGDKGTQLKRESAELVATPTRPLAPKLASLLEYLTGALAEVWGGKDAKDTAGKMQKMATYLSGGIELG